jgi:hypothetical protein
MTAVAVTAGAPAAPGLRLVAPENVYTRAKKTLGDPTPLACTVAKTALEVALGADGLDKLNRWVSSDVRARLARQQSLSRRGGYTVKGTVGIMRVRVHRVSARAAEVSVVAREGERVRAIAMRLEELAGRWHATALEVG